ncbi:MAG TPA: molybdopterin-dependent oxidoreductase [Pirellulales bacterium]|jgi:DMSO/TMAO reductase YedYZ molybdopterin-dependent catalytic subunit|nr:molybdopterin-dependent oxidoreductase [Pirellulales bacterium]
MHIRGKSMIGAMALVALGIGSVLAAPAQESTPALVVTNESGRETRLSADDLLAMPRTKAQVKDRDGKVAAYEGVTLAQVLERAEVPLGKSLRGPRLASYLLVEATDGYRVVFALPELDAASTDQLVLLADRKDGQPLPAKEGPWRIVVPHEKQHSRWIRQVESMRVVSALPAAK